MDFVKYLYSTKSSHARLLHVWDRILFWSAFWLKSLLNVKSKRPFHRIHGRGSIAIDIHTRDIKLSLIRRVDLASAYKDRLLSCAQAWQLAAIFSFQTARLYIFSGVVQCRPAYDIFARDRLIAKPRIHISATNTPLKFFNMSMHDQLFINPLPAHLIDPGSTASIQ